MIANKISTAQSQRDLHKLQFRKFKKFDKVKRTLFGPVDHAYSKIWLEAQLFEQMRSDSIKWNFDFSDGKYKFPVANGGVQHAPKKCKIVEECDSSQFYFQPIDPVRNETEASTSAPGSHSQRGLKQRLITDFMMKKKRSAPAVKETSERPNKIAKLTTGDCSS